MTTALSYALLAAVLLVPRLKDYRTLLLVLSLQIVFTTLGMEWLYSIYEDYVYITLRSVLFQLLSLIMMFAFVHTPDHLLVYAGIVTLSSTGANTVNYFHAKRYCRVRPVKRMDWKRHMKPILILFGMSLTVTIYVSSDTTILGILCGEYTVGIYSASVKVYTAVKTVLSSILIVSIPRLSALLGQDDKDAFNRQASDIYATLLTFVIPAIVGIILLRRQIVLLIAGKSFLPATSSLALLAVALFFCMGAWFWGQCIMLPLKMDTANFQITIISALLNIVLNFILIPIWKENAAAFTTILAEGFSFLGCRYFGGKYVKLQGSGKILIKVTAGCVSIVCVWAVLQLLILNVIANTVCTVILSIIIYLCVEACLNNQVMVDALHKLTLRLGPVRKR